MSYLDSSDVIYTDKWLFGRSRAYSIPDFSPGNYLRYKEHFPTDGSNMNWRRNEIVSKFDRAFKLGRDPALSILPSEYAIMYNDWNSVREKWTNAQKRKLDEKLGVGPKGMDAINGIVDDMCDGVKDKEECLAIKILAYKEIREKEQKRGKIMHLEMENAKRRNDELERKAKADYLHKKMIDQWEKEYSVAERIVETLLDSKAQTFPGDMKVQIPDPEKWKKETWRKIASYPGYGNKQPTMEAMDKLANLSLYPQSMGFVPTKMVYEEELRRRRIEYVIRKKIPEHREKDDNLDNLYAASVIYAIREHEATWLESTVNSISHKFGAVIGFDD